MAQALRSLADLDARPARVVDDHGAWCPHRCVAHNGVEFFDLQFACARTGAICVLLNWRLTVSELDDILSDSSPKLLVHDTEFSDAAGQLRDRCGIDHLLEIDGGADDSDYERALTASTGVAVDRAALTHDDVITIMYTSRS